MDKQLTLGGLISRLEKLPRDSRITFDFGSLEPGTFHSYRGDYSQLGLEPVERTSTGGACVGPFLDRCLNALSTTFSGYKGGEFDMGPETSVWVANYGDTSKTVIVGVVANKYWAYLVTKSDLSDDCDDLVEVKP